MHHPKKILLAEDDHDDRTLFFTYLEGRPDVERLHIVENGIEVFNYLDGCDSTDLPHLIVLDHNMPKKNGLQTLAELKTHEHYAHIPVMVYSTYTDNYLVKECTGKGALVVTSKPVSKDGYHEMMDSFLSAIK